LASLKVDWGLILLGALANLGSFRHDIALIIWVTEKSMLALNHSQDSVAASDVPTSLSDSRLLDKLFLVLFCIILDIGSHSGFNELIVWLVMAIRFHSVLQLHLMIEVKVAVN
jgi:hypothetical protein